MIGYVHNLFPGSLGMKNTEAFIIPDTISGYINGMKDKQTPKYEDIKPPLFKEFDYRWFCEHKALKFIYDPQRIPMRIG